MENELQHILAIAKRLKESDPELLREVGLQLQQLGLSMQEQAWETVKAPAEKVKERSISSGLREAAENIRQINNPDK